LALGIVPLSTNYAQPMKQLWSPWRSTYVADGARDGAVCFLCQAAKISARDPVAGVVHVAEHSLILLNRFPYSAGHVLVTTKLHVADITDLEVAAYSCLMQSVRTAVEAVRGAYNPDGVNVGINLGSAAGAGVPDHVHVHVVPRWNGDTNFMPVIADVKVISATLEESWGRICRALDSTTESEGE